MPPGICILPEQLENHPATSLCRFETFRWLIRPEHEVHPDIHDPSSSEKTDEYLWATECQFSFKFSEIAQTVRAIFANSDILVGDHLPFALPCAFKNLSTSMALLMQLSYTETPCLLLKN